MAAGSAERVAPVAQLLEPTVRPVSYPPLRQLPWVPATWLAYPTLSGGNGGVSKSAGANFHREEIAQLIRKHGPLVMAELRIEERGQYAGAVRVFVDRQMVSAIPHQHADPYREIVRRLNEQDKPSTCRAELQVAEYVDVWLAAKPEERDEKEPFLPELGVGVQVRLNQDGREYVEHLLGPRARNKRIKPVAELNSDGTIWTVILDELPIGELPRGTYTTPNQAREAAFPTTARLLIVRKEGRPLRITAGFPQGS
jgi:hypothetical protein